MLKLLNQGLPNHGAKRKLCLLACLAVGLSAMFLTAVMAAAQAQPPASLSGTVVDRDGAFIAAARISLTAASTTVKREILSDASGHFIFEDVPPGPFQITVSAAGFGTQETSGLVQAGEACVVPQIALVVAIAVSDVTVMPADVVAEQQIKVEETQRVLGVVPNFFVSYLPNAVPLNTRQKFELAWKTTVDPVSFGITAAIAGIEQADNAFGAYGQGAQGYAKRYGAAYGDFLSGVYIGGAILPALLKQDPRYFVKGTGTRKSRVLYALANSVIRKGDNGHWQPDYSGIGGSLASAGISNLYYPAADRNGARLTFVNTLIGVGGGALANVIQEFLVRKITPHAPNQDRPKREN